ncbi:hypothetical protein KY289_017553 [Solanum tuberosum]|nr:hypothetical protein KY289_017553 [Solanum tuberosum]
MVFSYTEWKPWGIPDDYECEVIENDAPVPKHIPLHRPGPLPEEFYSTLEAITSGKLETSKKDEPAIASGRHSHFPAKTDKFWRPLTDCYVFYIPRSTPVILGENSKFSS